MAWSYRRRIKIIPGIRLNFSKSGISTSIGVMGSTLTLGKTGTFISTSVPILGIYNRQKINGLELMPDKKVDYTKNLNDHSENILSADIQDLTSQNMQGIKEAILLAVQQKRALNSDLFKIKASIIISTIKLILCYLFIYGLLKKSVPKMITTDIYAQKEALRLIKTQIENSYINLDIEFEPEIHEKYTKLVDSFKNLTTSNKIWDVTSSQYQDSTKARSSASTIVKKQDVKFDLKALQYIRSNFEALHLKNSNGADLYFYPSFIVMYSSKTNFALIGLDEIIFNQSDVSFTETGKVPNDSKILYYTWAKVNKNGTPDKRFKNNYQIPVVKYGKISLKTSTGLNEVYQFSNYEYTEKFGLAFRSYQQTFIKLKNQ